ncbi:MAG: hypothetical protein WCG27_08240 [Pseudomonadota bacterium]
MNTQLLHFIIRVPKKESAYTYALLESHEGLCFYSTLDLPPDYQNAGPNHCLIDLKGHISLKNEIWHLLRIMQDECQMEILKEILKDEQISEG